VKRDLRYERFLKHPPERVWRALTEPALMGRWLMETDFEPTVGHVFQFRTDPAPTFDGILNGEVVLVEPPRQIAYTFIGGMMRHKTTVKWTLHPEDGGTRLILEHTGFTGLSDVAISGIIGFGWKRMLNDLPAVLDSLAQEVA